MGAKKPVTAAVKAERMRPTYSGAPVIARFDNSLHTPDTQTLFRNADALAMNAALDPAVRKTVRERARYVVFNVPYAWSMLRTYVAHAVGRWATISFPRGGIPEDIRQRVTDDFDAWAMKTDFWETVKTLLRAKVTDGEAFALLFTDGEIVDDTNRVSLNVRAIECDRVESWRVSTRPDEIDGIRFTANGHPSAYRVLDYHPGDTRDISKIRWKSGDWKDARYVIHYFDRLRPEQVRGVSDFVSALEIPALQKSFRLSVVETAINAASFSGIMHTDQVPEYFDNGQPVGKCAADVKPNTAFQVQRGAFVTMPEGWSVTQLHAEQPTSLYDGFVRSIIAEMAACLCMPVNVAMCDSSQHNFASAKLDHMTYGDHIGDVRAALSVKVLDRVFFAWLEEYAAINRIEPSVLSALHRTEWLFTERGNADVMKDASADNTRLANGTTTRAALYAKDGRDWKRETEQALEECAFIYAKWREYCKRNGLDENTPCPISQKANAPTADMIEHDAEKRENRDGDAPDVGDLTKRPNAKDKPKNGNGGNDDNR